MNKKKRLLLVLFAVAALLIPLSGCKKEEAKTTIPENLEDFVWHGEREKPFGIHEYEELTKDEAERLLKEKFSLKQSALPNIFEEIVEKGLKSEKTTAAEPIYMLNAQEDKLVFRSIYQYFEGEDLACFAYIESEYTYNSETKTVKLADQTLSLSKSGDYTTFPNENGEELVEQLGEALKIASFDEALLNFKENYPESGGGEIAVSDNGTEAYENKGIRTAVITRVKDQKIVEIAARLVDYTE